METEPPLVATCLERPASPSQLGKLYVRSFAAICLQKFSAFAHCIVLYILNGKADVLVDFVLTVFWQAYMPLKLFDMKGGYNNGMNLASLINDDLFVVLLVTKPEDCWPGNGNQTSSMYHVSRNYCCFIVKFIKQYIGVLQIWCDASLYCSVPSNCVPAVNFFQVNYHHCH